MPLFTICHFMLAAPCICGGLFRPASWCGLDQPDRADGSGDQRYHYRWIQKRQVATPIPSIRPDDFSFRGPTIIAILKQVLSGYFRTARADYCSYFLSRPDAIFRPASKLFRCWGMVLVHRSDHCAAWRSQPLGQRARCSPF